MPSGLTNVPVRGDKMQTPALIVLPIILTGLATRVNGAFLLLTATCIMLNKLLLETIIDNRGIFWQSDTIQVYYLAVSN